MNNRVTRTSGSRIVLTKPGSAPLTPWLQSVQAATGLDPRATVSKSAILALDSSGSMIGSCINQAIQGARKFNADALSSGHQVGLVTFATKAILLSPVSRAGIVEHLSSIECGGSTNMADAISVAFANLRGSRGLMTIVLVTDGFPDNADATLAAADAAKVAGVRIVTIGTENADLSFLKRLASSSSAAVATSTERLSHAMGSATLLLPK